MTATIESTIRDIVTGDYRAAAVFQRYGIDFCCGGERTVDDACRDRGLIAAEVLEEVASACGDAGKGVPRFGSWEPATLISYIVANHHSYVRRMQPAIAAHAQKVAAVHGANHPELREVERVFAGVVDEMTSHMAKEEHVLFPYITALADATHGCTGVPPAPFGSIDNPIRMMEAEHESAGGAMARIRALTGGYAAPADACTTYRVCLQELEDFERDLHVHVHLENNILFPKARRLEAGVHSQAGLPPSRTFRRDPP